MNKMTTTERRIAQRIMSDWLKTARGARWLNAKNPGRAVVNLDTGRVRVTRLKEKR